MSDDRAYAVLLGTAVRRFAVSVADQARAAGSCGHPGALYASALAPEAGHWCAACGAAHMGDLLTMPWCCMCDGDTFARPGITAARAVRLEILLRLCDRCLTRDADEDQEDGER
ncbi:hypothetical protein StrepF001_15000 [Streptomyces sp. F001]|uniref:hypothetical protein n=1 Tax=Streptomyces sp. F001 TaxID=1510026 RepID=UPI00101E5069|nr:hypothetical protein [Streptomyces sp. F001]RZB18385.1 hypothetical protein StrepF001_15000 [Streptomyces sp. F001]